MAVSYTIQKPGDDGIVRNEGTSIQIVVAFSTSVTQIIATEPLYTLSADGFTWQGSIPTRTLGNKLTLTVNTRLLPFNKFLNISVPQLLIGNELVTVTGTNVIKRNPTPLFAPECKINNETVGSSGIYPIRDESSKTLSIKYGSFQSYGTPNCMRIRTNGVGSTEQIIDFQPIYNSWNTQTYILSVNNFEYKPNLGTVEVRLGFRYGSTNEEISWSSSYYNFMIVRNPTPTTISGTVKNPFTLKSDYSLDGWFIVNTNNGQTNGITNKVLFELKDSNDNVVLRKTIDDPLQIAYIGSTTINLSVNDLTNVTTSDLYCGVTLYAYLTPYFHNSDVDFAGQTVQLNNTIINTVLGNIRFLAPINSSKYTWFKPIDNKFSNLKIVFEMPKDSSDYHLASSIGEDDEEIFSYQRDPYASITVTVYNSNLTILKRITISDLTVANTYLGNTSGIQYQDKLILDIGKVMNTYLSISDILVGIKIDSSFGLIQ